MTKQRLSRTKGSCSKRPRTAVVFYQIDHGQKKKMPSLSCLNKLFDDLSVTLCRNKRTFPRIPRRKRSKCLLSLSGLQNEAQSPRQRQRPRMEGENRTITPSHSASKQEIIDFHQHSPSKEKLNMCGFNLATSPKQPRNSWVATCADVTATKSPRNLLLDTMDFSQEEIPSF